MMPDEFERLLAAFEDAPADAETATVISGAVKVEAPSKTALKTDHWSERIAERLAEEWWCQGDIEQTVSEITDAHTACFEPRPQLAQQCTNPVRQRWFEDLLQSPDFKALHSSTCFDDALSQIAAKQIVERFQEYELSKDSEDLTDDEGNLLDRADEGIGGLVGRIRSVGKAIRGAAGDVSDARDAANAFCEADGDGATNDPQAVLKAFQAIQNNPILRQISDNAGRFTRMAKSLQRQKPTHGMDDVVGVELASDLNRLTATELSCLMDEDLELDLLRRAIEGQAMCREYKGVTNVSRGPIMVLVDESGSMGDAETAAAKGFALSMAWLAQHQKRWCCLVGWSSANQVRELVIEPGTRSGEIMQWCLTKWNGGTSPPVEFIPELFELTGAPSGRTDVIWITDGECNPQGVEVFNKWRAEHAVKVWTIGVGCAAKSFEPFSDVVTQVRDIHTGQPVVSELLSL